MPLSSHSKTHLVPTSFIPRLYGEIDHLYGLPGLTSNSGFTSAQATLNVIEATLGLEYIYLTHFSQNKRWRRGEKRSDPKAPLIGFAAAVMMLSKTLLYGLQGRCPPRVCC